jgi:pimeloyl-ACP methyl ester carboxylesterase
MKFFTCTILGTTLAGLYLFATSACVDETRRAKKDAAVEQKQAAEVKDDSMPGKDSDKKQEYDKDDAASEDKHPNVVLIFSGGRGSCGSDEAEGGFLTTGNYIRPAFDRYLEVIKSRRSKVSSFITCFEKSDTKMALADDADPQIARSIVFEDLFTELQKKVSAIENPSVYLVGHSYGGWLAMQLASSLDKKANIRLLATIDPISRVTCGTDNFTKWGIDGLFSGNWFAEEIEGCDSYPKDISAANRSAIKKRTVNWVNYFQTSYRILHSSAIPEAHENIERSFIKGYNKAHDDIGLEAEQLLKYVEADLK